MRRIFTAFIPLVLLMPPSSASAAPQASAPEHAITLERIMAHPDWIGRSPQRAYWSDDAGLVYFRQKREGEELTDLYRIPRAGGEPERVPDDQLGRVDEDGGDLDAARRRKVYSRNGDLFLKNLESGEVTQLTRTASSESGPRFMHGDDRIMFRRHGETYVRVLATGLEYQPADVRAQKDPDEKEDEEKDYLDRQQDRLFDVVRREKEQREAQKDRRKEIEEADPTRGPRPFWLGDGIEITGQTLSPRGDFLVVTTRKKGRDDAKRDSMPVFVTEDGYVETRSVRSKVGTGTPRGESLIVLNLETRDRHDIDLAVLPGIADDPLAEVRAANEQQEEQEQQDEDGAEAEREAVAEEREPASEARIDEPGEQETPDLPAEADAEEKQAPEPKPRPVSIAGIDFSDDGTHLILQCFSLDSKDRWLARIDLETMTLVPIHHDRDEAWINWRFSRAGWIPDSHVVWFLSEQTGWSHLSVYDVDTGEPRQLTSGRYEVSSVRPSHDGTHLYYTANVEHPGIYETWRLRVADGQAEQLTRLGGINRSELSLDEQWLLIEHSSILAPPELYVQRNEPGAEAQRLTFTVSEEFRAIPWPEPEVVAIPSRTGRSIHARLFLPQGQEGRSPVVFFIHGAGYLQNAHYGWSRYFREFMFHGLLAEHGYTVVDLDYRASAGYGRDWRTAIYRQMGTPELEDLEDAILWLNANHAIDRDRIGIYGGSYGGFVTLMALFRRPDLVACGAALRPVTDWAHYNHGYTSRILNIPDLDPAAYEGSSPIEFADGLEGALLICHGMLDDNVFFQDTVRLAQRLIELKKTNWEVAVYPVEPHSFRQPESWLDEYRRIFALFERELKGREEETKRRRD